MEQHTKGGELGGTESQNAIPLAGPDSDDNAAASGVQGATRTLPRQESDNVRPMVLDDDYRTTAPLGSSAGPQASLSENANAAEASDAQKRLDLASKDRDEVNSRLRVQETLRVTTFAATALAVPAIIVATISGAAKLVIDVQPRIGGPSSAVFELLPAASGLLGLFVASALLVAGILASLELGRSINKMRGLSYKLSEWLRDRNVPPSYCGLGVALYALHNCSQMQSYGKCAVLNRHFPHLVRPILGKDAVDVPPSVQDDNHLFKPIMDWMQTRQKNQEHAAKCKAERRKLRNDRKAQGCFTKGCHEVLEEAKAHAAGGHEPKSPLPAFGKPLHTFMNIAAFIYAMEFFWVFAFLLVGIAYMGSKSHSSHWRTVSLSLIGVLFAVAVGGAIAIARQKWITWEEPKFFEKLGKRAVFLNAVTIALVIGWKALAPRFETLFWPAVMSIAGSGFGLLAGALLSEFNKLKNGKHCLEAYIRGWGHLLTKCDPDFVNVKTYTPITVNGATAR